MLFGRLWPLARGCVAGGFTVGELSTGFGPPAFVPSPGQVLEAAARVSATASEWAINHAFSSGAGRGIAEGLLVDGVGGVIHGALMI